MERAQRIHLGLNAEASVFDQADKSLLEDAREALTEKLLEGRFVGNCNFYALIDGAVNDRDHKRAADFILELDTLLRRDGGDDTVEGLAGRIRDKLIADYLDAHPELVQEEAETLQERWAA